MGYQQKFINSTVGSQLLRFACQKAVGDLSLAHLLWDRLRKQGDVPERQACRSYYMALKQRDSDEERLANVSQPPHACTLETLVSQRKEGVSSV